MSAPGFPLNPGSSPSVLLRVLGFPSAKMDEAIVRYRIE